MLNAFERHKPLSLRSHQQHEGNQTNLLTCQKLHQSSPPTSSQQQKSTLHSKHNKCLQSPGKGICHDQKSKQIQNV